MGIDSYRFGEVLIDGKAFMSDVIIFPDRVRSSWWRKEGHELALQDLEEVLAEKPEVLVVGTGASGCMRVLPETERELKRRGIELRAEPTGAACTLYNELSKKRKAVAALHLTC
ncbi:MAG: Mth938-like domain-containing protein, partial [Nitrospinota bacterium]